MKFYVVLEPAEEGGFNVSVPALDWCFTEGETEEEALRMLSGGARKGERYRLWRDKAKPGALAREVTVAL
ncbi:MAG: type II toxin-antitoxin system HicB family antitoxin [Deltaproteobacteria bacterium]|nr:type II toxin-antitoxin system HicB family antitoxin [Deltaproteobacteria bacterium]